MDRKGPLADAYPAAVALVLLALTPYLVLTTALQPLQELIAKDTGLSMRSLQLGTGMANAAYAVGAVVAVQLAERLPQRRLLVGYAALFVLGSAMAAWSPVAGFFLAGHVLQGLATGLMLIGAVPPLILSYGKEKLPSTAVVMNLGLFGAVALGPVVGGASGGTQTWKPLFWIVTGLGALAFLFAVLTYEDEPPRDTDAPVDVVALALATLGCASLFFGVSELMGRHAYDLVVLGPVLLGLASLVALFVHESLVDDPLIPVKKLFHTVPVAAIVVAMAAGAASVALVQLCQIALQTKGSSPNHAGMLFWPEFGAAVLAAVIFGRIFFTRWTILLAVGGLFLLGGGGVIVTGVATGGDALVVVGSALIGFGVGSSVSPALFLAGFSLDSPQLPRVFAIVELLRGVAAFLVGPALLQLAMTTGSTPAVGIRTAIWIAAGIALLGGAVAVLVLLLGRFKPAEPQVGPWLAGEQPALASAPVADVVREDATQHGGRRELEAAG